jgi:hypothetical protein
MMRRGPSVASGSHGSAERGARPNCRTNVSAGIVHAGRSNRVGKAPHLAAIFSTSDLPPFLPIGTVEPDSPCSGGGGVAGGPGIGHTREGGKGEVAVRLSLMG